MKEFNTLSKRTKATPTRKQKIAPKAKRFSLPRKQSPQPILSWQLLIDRERMLI